MAKNVSVIIPNKNGEKTIGRCLEAVYASGRADFEVIVVDDASGDHSTRIIEKFPCRLIRLEAHGGAAKARNAGARASEGKILFFTDADCLPEKGAIAIAEAALARLGAGAIVGGTYTRAPADKNFFSFFQSVLINYFETKNCDAPDYVATHAMAMDAESFLETGGFREDSLPILEDVEFSHRARSAGFTLVMLPQLRVRHIFNFTFYRSVGNAVRKSMYWTLYSIGAGDLLADSGVASVELKANVALGLLAMSALGASLYFHAPLIACLAAACYLASLIVNRGLARAFHEANGAFFATAAMLYYTTIYALAVGFGAALGVIKYAVARRESAARS